MDTLSKAAGYYSGESASEAPMRELDKVEQLADFASATASRLDGILYRITGSGTPQNEATAPMPVGYLAQLNRLGKILDEINSAVNRLGDIA